MQKTRVGNKSGAVFRQGEEVCELGVGFILLCHHGSDCFLGMGIPGDPWDELGAEEGELTWTYLTPGLEGLGDCLWEGVSARGAVGGVADGECIWGRGEGD